MGSRLVFPIEITVTNLRPDILIYSRLSKQIIIMELTVPWEDRMGEANARKRDKYEELINTCKEQGWKTWFFPIEIGSRGYIAKSTVYAIKQLGITSKQERAILQDASDQAEKASTWLWLKRKAKDWSR